MSRLSKWRGGVGESGRIAYAFARSGLIGLFVWVFRREIDRAATRHVGGIGAVAALLVAFLLFVAGNRLHLRPLSFIGGWGFVVIGVLWLAGHLQRLKEEAWAAEHGRDSEAFRAEVERDQRHRDSNLTRDDWLIDPPWRRDEARPRQPRFGQDR